MAKVNAYRLIDEALIDALQELIVQYQQLVKYYQLPFYKRWFKDLTKVFIQSELSAKLEIVASIKSIRAKADK